MPTERRPNNTASNDLGASIRWLLLLPLMALIAACSGPPDPTGPALATDGAHDRVADVLPVSCADGVLSLGADNVRVHADGLHVDVQDLPDRSTSVELGSPDETQPLAVGSGGVAHGTGPTLIATVAPGPVLVRCYPDDGPRHMLAITEDEEAMTVEIVDEGGHWTQPEPLDCDGVVAHMHPDYASPPEPPVAPVEPLVDAVDAADAADVRTYGYPEGTTRWVSVVIDGEIVSRGTYVRSGTSWRFLGSTTCG